MSQLDSPFLISNLPVELQCQILRIGCQLRPTETDRLLNVNPVPPRLRRFARLASQVCKSWRSMVKRNMSMWYLQIGFINGPFYSQNSMQQYQRWLEEYRDCDIEIYIDDTDDVYPQGNIGEELHLDQCIRLLENYSHRWVVLSIAMRNRERAHDAIEYTMAIEPEPPLRSISIVGPSYQNDRSSVPIKLRKSKTQVHASFVSLVPSWDPSDFPTNLKSLVLGHHIYEHCPSWTEFDQILAASPNLVYLEITNSGPLYEYDVASGSKVLQNLETLKLKQPFKSIFQFLTHFDLWRLSSLTINVTIHETWDWESVSSKIMLPSLRRLVASQLTPFELLFLEKCRLPLTWQLSIFHQISDHDLTLDLPRFISQENNAPARIETDSDARPLCKFSSIHQLMLEVNNGVDQIVFLRGLPPKTLRELIVIGYSEDTDDNINATRTFEYLLSYDLVRNITHFAMHDVTCLTQYLTIFFCGMPQLRHLSLTLRTRQDSRVFEALTSPHADSCAPLLTEVDIRVYSDCYPSSRSLILFAQVRNRRGFSIKKLRLFRYDCKVPEEEVRRRLEGLVEDVEVHHTRSFR